MKKDIVIVIFGATGDLTARKLMPALIKLHTTEEISKNIQIIAVGRRAFDASQYVDHLNKQVTQPFNYKDVKDILSYVQIDFEKTEDYKRLADEVKTYCAKHTRQLYYLAIGPDLFKLVVKHMSDAKMIDKGAKEQSIIFEKPFGHDLKSAQAINQFLWQHFDEKQIYRIDHYLGKEMIQNIMMVRFANRIFEETWHNRSIKSVKIIAKETEGILNRAGYYDQSGALRDMVQSHLLQMLSLVAMEVPLSYQSEDVKTEKIKVLKDVVIDQSSIIFGQYDGYLHETNIPKDSQTETLVFFKAFVNTPRFKGVPFYLFTGKKLALKETVIEIEFEETNEQRKWNLPLSTNKLLIKIAPLDGVALRLNSKVPGLKDDVEQVEMEYCIACHAVGNMSEAYEKLLLDAITHHKSLFARWDEIEYSWQLIDHIKALQIKPRIYQNQDDVEAWIKEKIGDINT
ncbi:MAG: glucose-6-phosphate dehydrogenase [Acholeplasmataceae bacterium]